MKPFTTNKFVFDLFRLFELEKRLEQERKAGAQQREELAFLEQQVDFRIMLKICTLQKLIFSLEFLGPVHTKTIVNANASKRKLFYAFMPSVHTETMKTLTVNA